VDARCVDPLGQVPPVTMHVTNDDHRYLLLTAQIDESLGNIGTWQQVPERQQSAKPWRDRAGWHLATLVFSLSLLGIVVAQRSATARLLRRPTASAQQ